MKRRGVEAWAVFFLATVLHAQLSVPQLGFARFADGSVHAIQGVAANLIVSPRAVATANRASFSNAGGLTAKNGLIQLWDASGKQLASYQSDEALPLVNIDSSLQTAIAWLPSSHVLLTWDGTTLVARPLDDAGFEGTVTFVRLESAAIAQFFLVQANSKVAKASVSLPSGRLISSDILPGPHGVLFVQSGWILSQSDEGLVAEMPDGYRQTISLLRNPLLTGDLTIERMSTDWLHVSSQATGASWAIFLSGTKLNVSVMPHTSKGVAR
jgi:hypothetical protein